MVFVNSFKFVVVLSCAIVLFAFDIANAHCPAQVVAGGPITSKGDTDYLVLQFSTNLLGGGLGSLLRFETPDSTPTVLGARRDQRRAFLSYPKWNPDQIITIVHCSCFATIVQKQL
jgi:hypothetical protein